MRHTMRSDDESVDESGTPGGTDEQAFLNAMQDVAPISHKRQVQKSRPVASPGQQQRREDAEGKAQEAADRNTLTLGEVPARAPLEFLEWKQNGVQNAVFDKLRRGEYRIEASLDLHRKTVREARVELFAFIRRANALQQRCVLISPGKGEFSETPGRLKSYVAWWLEQHELVIAFCSAQRQQGGVGAVYALIKKSPASKEDNRERHGLQSDPHEPF